MDSHNITKDLNSLGDALVCFVLDEKMRETWSVKQPHVKAKILGVTFIIIGLVLLMDQSALFLKLGLGCILIGLFSIVMISEKTIPEHLGKAQIKGPLTAMMQIITQLNLKGNAIFLPQNSVRSEERIFIPLRTTETMVLPDIDDELVFTTGSNNTSLGIALSPSGLALLQEIEKETRFDHTNLDELEEKLQTFVGMDLVQSISLKEKNNDIQVQIKKPLYCSDDTCFCNQYPCPTCSAALTAISKATEQKLRIIKTDHKKKQTLFHLTIME